VVVACSGSCAQIDQFTHSYFTLQLLVCYFVCVCVFFFASAILNRVFVQRLCTRKTLLCNCRSCFKSTLSIPYPLPLSKILCFHVSLSRSLFMFWS
jgi:O-antigen/teichoic acid export membrane protein